LFDTELEDPLLFIGFARPFRAAVILIPKETTKLMKARRFTGASALLLGVVLLSSAACSRSCGRHQDANDLAVTIQLNRPQVPIESAVEATYTWTAGPGFKKLGDYRVLVHFLDTKGNLLFAADHVPTPATASWEPGKTYTYSKTIFVPTFPYIGPVDVRLGVYPEGKGERVALRGEDAGMREYRSGRFEFLDRTKNIFLVYKEGWHSPETSADHPTMERTWTKREALVSMKNPKKDIVVYLEADTNTKAFTQQPTLTISVNGKTGVTMPIENSEVFLKKVHVKAADLGADEWVDLRLSLNQSFVPKALGYNNDDRELGLLVYHLYVAEGDKLGDLAALGVVEAGPVTLPSPPATVAAAPAAAKKK
jgi:hypothetical protein